MHDLKNYHYNKLDANEKKLYNAVVDAIVHNKTTCNAPYVDKVYDVNCAIINDYPEYFFFNKAVLKYGVKSNATYDVWYRCDMPRTLAPKLLNRAKALAMGLRGKTDYETMCNVHDFITHNVVYDDRELDPDVSYHENHCIWGPLMNHVAVCEGIARCVQLMLKYLGVGCTYMHNYLNGDKPKGRGSNHAWNIVEVDGKLVKLDATWDLSGKYSTKKKYLFVAENYWGE